MTAAYRLYGALGSPYSLKMRAILRYRRIAHVWVQGGAAHRIAAEKVKVAVIPVVEYPDGTFHNDSTPLLYDLERRHPGQRSILPEDEGDHFLAFLVEDFADEWLTKSMFHYRWFLPRDQERMSTWLAFDSARGGGRANFEAYAKVFRERQVGRMAIVGCTAENRPIIEGATRRFLAALDTHVVEQHFIFGSRPSLAEFGIYGQISQLGVDPTAHDMMRADYPYAYRWLYHMDDLSGVEGEWHPKAASPFLTSLLGLVAQYYLPFLEANAKAVAAGAEQVSLTLAGARYSQAPFKYQAKCLAALRNAYRDLSPAAKERVTPLLKDTGCLEPLAASQ